MISFTVSPQWDTRHVVKCSFLFHMKIFSSFCTKAAKTPQTLPYSQISKITWKLVQWVKTRKDPCNQILGGFELLLLDHDEKSQNSSRSCIQRVSNCIAYKLPSGKVNQADLWLSAFHFHLKIEIFQKRHQKIFHFISRLYTISWSYKLRDYSQFASITEVTTI